MSATLASPKLRHLFCTAFFSALAKASLIAKSPAVHALTKSGKSRQLEVFHENTLANQRPEREVAVKQTLSEQARDRLRSFRL
ncbi:hypothetical protein CWR43_17275 [Rhizobium sullae]|uniref:Uncharacterized protein n=1 Tax=Rhizobium sullae TaxID=50338 RepID=A0A2N0D871_RHISU|nr:hypothetical protein CWR43_17275 [Rhizobium sullae]